MNILIIGNLASGKTTIAKSLKKRYNCEYIGIDDLRRELSDGSFAGEFKAWAEMLSVIQNPSSEGTIIEFSGTGKNAWFVREAMKKSMKDHKAEWLVVYCLCDKDILIERNKDKKRDVPFPYDFSESAVSGINFISRKLKDKYNTNYWNSPEIIVRTDKMTVDEIVKEIEKYMVKK